MIEALAAWLKNFYAPPEYPALDHQIRSWSKTLPFAGMTIIDATPVFRNTMVKHLALLAGGAKLFAAWNDKVPCDPEICAMLPRFGIVPLPPGTRLPECDLIADCAGILAGHNARCGHVELTRSGLEYYRNYPTPVFSADSGILKKLETVSGTGDGFSRAMKQYGFSLDGKNILIFGGGKVGFGIAWHAVKCNAEVIVADVGKKLLPPGASLIDAADRSRCATAIAEADYIISVTGIAGALADYAADFNRCSAVIAAMGVEDEFGPDVPPARVLNAKRPLNFILEEPTHLKYIDATMALDNEGLLLLKNGLLPPGISPPPPDIESEILRRTAQYGTLGGEIDLCLKYNSGAVQNEL